MLVYYFTVFWYILRPFGIVNAHLVHIFPVLVCCRTTKNLATLEPGANPTIVSYNASSLVRFENNSLKTLKPNTYIGIVIQKS
jgi:hypothetical protein